MTVMFNVETDGAGNPIAGKRVYISLVANGAPGYSDNGEISIESVGEVLTDENGRWEANLAPNTDVIPEGTVYSARLKFRGGDYDHVFTVPDSGLDNWIGDHLAELPGALPSGALSGHLTDLVAAHSATSVAVTPSGGIAATTAQDALQELDTELIAETNARIAADNALVVALDGKEPSIPPGTFGEVDTTDVRVMYVGRGTKASDAKNGLSPGAAKATIAAAVTAGATVVKLLPGTHPVIVSGTTVADTPTEVVIEGSDPTLCIIATEANLTASGNVFRFPGEVDARVTLRNVTMQGSSTVNTTLTETDNGTPGGTFTLRAGSLTTAAIAPQSSAATIAAALDTAGIPYSGVTGGPLGTASVVIAGALPIVVTNNSVTNASVSAALPTLKGIVGSGSNHSFDRITAENVIWRGFWIHCIHLGAGVASGVHETGVLDVDNNVFDIVGSGIADFRGGGDNVHDMDAETYIRGGTRFVQFGVPGSSLYHGVYTSPGVSIDFETLKFLSNSGATSFAIHQYNQNLDGRQKVVITNAGTPSGTFTITANAQTTAGISVTASAADVKAALDALTGMGTVYVTGGPPQTGAALPASWTYNVGIAHAATVSGAGLTNASVAVSEKVMSTPKFARLSDIYIDSAVYSGIVVLSGGVMKLDRITNKASNQQMRYYTSFDLSDSDLSATSAFGALFAGGEVGVVAKMRGTKKGPGTSNTSSAPMTAGSNSGVVDLDDMTWPTVNRGTSPVAVSAAALNLTLLGANGRAGRNRWADANVVQRVGAIVPRAGAWLGAGGGSQSTTPNMVNGTLYAYPLEVPYDLTIQSIGLEITGGGSVGALIRLGLYLPNEHGYPGALLLDAGTIDGNLLYSTTPGIIAVSKALPASIVWVCAVLQGAPAVIPTVRTFTGNVGTVARQNLNSASTGNAGLSMTGVTGALPSTFASTVTANNFVPATMVQVAA